MTLNINRSNFRAAAVVAWAFAVLVTTSDVVGQPENLIVAPRSGQNASDSFFRAKNLARLSYSVRNPEQSKINALLKKMKSTEDSKTRRDIEKEMLALLNVQYEQKMEDYEKHLETLESKLKKMRNQLQRRRDAQDEMVDLRMKVLLAEADDLGWPGDTKPSRFPSVLPAAGFDSPPNLNPFSTGTLPRHVRPNQSSGTWVTEANDGSKKLKTRKNFKLEETEPAENERRRD